MINWLKSFCYNALALILYIILIIYSVTAINSAAKILFIDYAYSDRFYIYRDNQIFIESLSPEDKVETGLLSSGEITEKRLKALENQKIYIKSKNFASIFNDLLSIAISGILLFFVRRFNTNTKINNA